ncbi:MAG: dihydroorotate dehydrogenase [Endomicrobiales bacterium]|nr:dihydroorotate dehydrogenase [Endomicrobiales bacterium]
MANKADLNIEVAGLRLRSPVLTPSGTFGYGDELKDLLDYGSLGALITKTVTFEPKKGNPPPRTAEAASGVLNSIGLQNVGIKRFVSEKLPKIAKLRIPVIVSIAGQNSGEYSDLIGILNEIRDVSAVELNLSCPNLNKRIISQDAGLLRDIVGKAKTASKKPLIAKLSPQVADIAEMARIAEGAGADALSAVNTFQGMAIDVKTRKPKLANVTGGLSGPCVKPLALRCVWEVTKAVKIPVIGGGGISTAEDAVEYFLAGARAVTVGTAGFVDPGAAQKIYSGLKDYLAERKLESLADIIGKMEIN